MVAPFSLPKRMVAGLLWNPPLTGQAFSMLSSPEFRLTHEMLASLYAEEKQPEEALREYQTALHIYQALQPEFQKRSPVPRNPLSK
jgi:hypothetical protein